MEPWWHFQLEIQEQSRVNFNPQSQMGKSNRRQCMINSSKNIIHNEMWFLSLYANCIQIYLQYICLSCAMLFCRSRREEHEHVMGKLTMNSELYKLILYFYCNIIFCCWCHCKSYALFQIYSGVYNFSSQSHNFTYA